MKVGNKLILTDDNYFHQYWAILHVFQYLECVSHYHYLTHNYVESQISAKVKENTNMYEPVESPSSVQMPSFCDTIYESLENNGDTQVQENNMRLLTSLTIVFPCSFVISSYTILFTLNYVYLQMWVDGPGYNNNHANYCRLLIIQAQREQLQLSVNETEESIYGLVLNEQVTLWICNDPEITGLVSLVCYFAERRIFFPGRANILGSRK